MTEPYMFNQISPGVHHSPHPTAGDIFAVEPGVHCFEIMNGTVTMYGKDQVNYKFAPGSYIYTAGERVFIVAHTDTTAAILWHPPLES